VKRLQFRQAVALLGALTIVGVGGCPAVNGLFAIGGRDYSGIYSGNVSTTVSSVPQVAAPVTDNAYMSVAIDATGNRLIGDRAVAVGDRLAETFGPFELVYTIQSIDKSDVAVQSAYSIDATFSGLPGSGTGSVTLRYSGSNVLEYHENLSFGDSSVVFKVEKVGTLRK